MTILERIQAPTPKFFKRLRNIGLALAAVGGTIVASPIAVPAIVLTIAQYLTLSSSVMVAVGQTAVVDNVD